MDLNPTVPYDDIKWQLTADIENYDGQINEYKHNPIAHTIVSKPASDATRNGFRLVIPSNPDLQAQYQLALDNLKLKKELTKQLVYRGAEGDGYLSIGTLENGNSGDTSKPIVTANVVDVPFVHAFGQNHVQECVVNDDPTSNDYGKEQAIMVQPTQSGSQSGSELNEFGNMVPNVGKLDPIIIDQSRFCHVSLDKFEDDTHGTSMLVRCHNEIKALNIALEASGKMMREFTFKVLKSDQLMNEPEDQYRRDRAEISQVLNNEAIAFIHADDDLSKVSTPVAGIDTLFTFAWQSLAMASGIPKSVLTGEQAGTLAGAGQDVVNYYDSIKSVQEQLLKPEIEKVVQLLMWADNVAGGQLDPGSIDWHIEFNPLWSADDETQSQTFLNYANATNTLVAGGILAPDEGKAIIDGLGNNSVQAMQNTSTDSDTSQDSAEFTQDQIDAYRKELERLTKDG
ncbi:anti-CBASS protein Acb1 family protein [Lactobacillus amylolyticus]|uniref:anti-CBASS protein Acb1 family protein n=1 Tax=Lactobacillus amylolyticus TaxID=83683 RepID=UPI002490AFBC|nr:anti-CBASS Acb1 family protein [Lactobacillus amylolyticus]